MLWISAAVPTAKPPLVTPGQEARSRTNTVGLQGLTVKARVVVMDAQQARVDGHASGLGRFWRA
ncbi:hypothetical protein NZ708_15750 [Pseudomonas syringae pv. actinidiae ICMP 18708]|nr:hypothetical protein IYO_015770 [Pseudomonas syringae pv. actinidiae ICMP 18884]AOE57354.1 hypothetical protein NZ708_15750 [Pseudomonas syringae pv. actinidiae ICMP 18708]APP98311.1 hypothetical protein PsaNZ45_16300 [Pseudomonas syringae pv. actinidiae]APQ04068.1 hypothetical protein PsaNZ47_15745 [Pseudomonas syringae pv. actinidiae]PIH80148.1 hypothetical protein CTI50_21340 [Pseudomonas syringae pv. actinidiae]